MVAGPVLASERSASSWTTVVARLAGAEPSLLVESGSVVKASARATLIRVPVGGAVTVTVRERLAPLARLPTVGQVTTPAASEPASLAETNVTPAGSVSRTTTEEASEGPLMSEERRVGKVWAASMVAGPFFETTRSAKSPTRVLTRYPGAEPLLLVESGSAVAASTRATLIKVPVGGAVTVTVRNIVAPLAGLTSAGQVSTPAASEPASLAETKVTPAGRVSWTTTADASEGPLLVTVMGEVRFCAASTVAGPVFVTVRSAISVTVVVTRRPAAEPLLLVESGSSVAASARATLSSVPVGGAVTVTVRDRLAPLARLGTVGQVTTPEETVPPSLAETKVTAAGRVSRTTTEMASEGPSLV